MKLLKDIEDNRQLTEEHMKEFIDILLNPNVKEDNKLKLLKSYTKKEMQQIELTYLVKHLISTMYPVQPYYEGAMCVCGTGGDGSNSFNISTTVAFIVASAGVPVVKHGKKSITSHSGSTDVLQAMGIQTSEVASVIKQLDTKGLSFISATDSYPIMKYIQPIRKQIKSPTIFNLVGPLINPFKLTYQVMGVYDVTQLNKIAQTIKDLGRKRAIVVHGANGMDEATLSGNNIIYEINQNKPIKQYTINAKNYGLTIADNDALKGGTPEENKNIAINILNGNDQSSKKDVVILNAAIALYVAEKAKDIHSGIKLVRHLIDSGQAMKQYLKMGV